MNILEKVWLQGLEYLLEKVVWLHLGLYPVPLKFRLDGISEMYIKSDEPLNKTTLDGSRIHSFIEKPNLIKAKEFIKDDRFTWNSGIFLFKASSILNEVERFSPNTVKYCREALSKKKLDLDFLRLDKNAFQKCPNISIDVAVMEKTNIAIVCPLDAGWSDVGSWDFVWKISKRIKKVMLLRVMYLLKIQKILFK